MIIRPATHGDLSAIAALQIRSWRDAYQGMLPPAYFSGPIVDEIVPKWAKLMPTDLVLVATRSDDEMSELTGFAATRLNNPRGAYLDNFHTDPEARGMGVGTALFAAMKKALVARDHTRMWLTVMAENTRARAFYVHRGGVERNPHLEAFFGAEIEMFETHWDKL